MQAVTAALPGELAPAASMAAMARFTKRKRHHDPVAHLIAQAPELREMARSIANCASCLKVMLELPEGGDPFARLLEYNPCNRRACPMCEWRRSMVWRGRLLTGLDAFFTAHPKHRAIFATFTVRNVPIDQLGQAVRDIHAGWNRLNRCRFFPSPYWFRRTEVTLGEPPSSPEAPKTFRSNSATRAEVGGETVETAARLRGLGDNNTLIPRYAHPHIHALILVPSSYFSHGYVRQMEWVRQWQMAARLDYAPIVDVRRARATFTTAEAFYDARAAGIEAMKYAVKATDMVKMGQHLPEFVHQMRGHRLVSMSRALREFVPAHDPTASEMGSDDAAGITQLHPGVMCVAQWDREVSNYSIRPA